MFNKVLILVYNKIGFYLLLWKDFSKEIMKYINEEINLLVWIFWGSEVKFLEKKIDKSKYYIVKGGYLFLRVFGRKFFC